MRTTLPKLLTQDEKDLIVSLYQGGNYYIKEICEKFNITKYTLFKVVDENEIRSKTSEM